MHLVKRTYLCTRKYLRKDFFLTKLQVSAVITCEPKILKVSMLTKVDTAPLGTVLPQHWVRNPTPAPLRSWDLASSVEKAVL